MVLLKFTVVQKVHSLSPKFHTPKICPLSPTPLSLAYHTQPDLQGSLSPNASVDRSRLLPQSGNLSVCLTHIKLQATNLKLQAPDLQIGVLPKALDFRHRLGI